MPTGREPSRARPGSRRGPVYSDLGIVLRSHKLGESDKIVRVMTREHGKRSVVAKGLRKTSSRFGARLEPFTCARMLVHEGRNLDTMRQAEIEVSNREVREDLELFVYGSAMAELVDGITSEHQPHPELFDLLRTGLQLLVDRPEHAPFVLSFFGVRAMAEAGFALRVAGCAVCGGAVGEGEASFSLHLGGMVCDACRARGAEGGKLVRVGAPTAALLRWMAAHQLGEWSEQMPPPAAERELRLLMDRVLEHWMEREFRSHRVMKVMPGSERGSGG